MGLRLTLPGAAVRYGIGVAVVALATLLQLGLREALGEVPPFITFYPALTLVALIAGGRAGVLATLLSALSADFFCLPPHGFGIERPVDVVALAFFTGAGLLISFMASRLHRARQREAATAERESEAKFSKAFAASPDAMVLSRADDGLIREINESGLRLFGFDRHEVIGKRSTDLGILDLTDRERALAVLRTGARLRDYELPIHRRSGEIRSTLCSVEPIEIAGESLILSIVRDVTERKQAEEALRRSEEQFRAFFNTSAMGTAEVSPDGRFVAVNDRYCQITGYSREELLALHPLQLSHPDDREHDAQGCMRHLGGELPAYDAEKRYVRKDGQVIWVRLTAAMSCDAAGKPWRSFGIVQDITGRKRAEEALRESEERFRTAFENGAIPMTLTALGGRLLKVNSAFCQMVGYAPEELAGREFASLTHPDDLGENLAGIQRVASGEAFTFRMEKRYIRKDGSLIWVDMSTASALDPHGRPLYLVTHVQDISKRKHAEEALRESEQRLFMAKEAADLAIFDYDIASGRIQWDSRLREFWGLAADERVTLELFMAGVHPEDRAATQAAADRAMNPAGDGRFAAEHRVVSRKDGRERWVAAAGQVFFQHGKAVRMVGTVQDITERRQAEESLQAVSGELRRTLDTAAAGLTHCSRDMRYVSVNPAYARWIGLAQEQIVGRPMVDVMGRAAFEVIRPCIECVLRGERVECEVELPLAGGAKPIHVVYTPDRDNSGNVVGWVASVTDISERRRAAQELLAAKARAEQAKAVAEDASRAKDQFIAILSHELRTPLTPALAAVSMMEADTRLPGETREDLAMVRRNIALEVRLIADLLDVSRVISGKLHLEKRPMDVTVAIGEAARIVSGDLDAKGQTLTIETPDSPCLTFGDAARLQQVFWNLLRNAIKFTPHRGRIAIRASVAPVGHCPLAAQPCPVGMGDCPLPCASAELKVLSAEEEATQHSSGGNLTVEVSDNGCGIAPEVLPRLFAPFEQGGEGRSLGGLGLGLSICKAVVDMHGGALTARSDGPGKGATFTVRLPIAQCPLGSAERKVLSAEPEDHSAPSTQHSALRILLVEDHADTAKLMSRLLATVGHEVTVADSVAAGLAAVEQAAGKLDLLISDLGLPDGSGHDLMRQLLEQGKAIPGIALSGYGAPADIEKSKAAGFSEHLVKPIGPDLIAAAIQRVTSYRNLVNRRG